MSRDRLTCKRCGRCCISSSPTLHKKDLTLVKKRQIDTSFLYTIRKGEYVWDNIEQRLRKVPEEMIKVREKGEKGGCIFYDPTNKACTIYPYRPAQCVALFCQDTSEFFRLYRTPKLSRRDVLKDPSLLRLLEEQERRCSYEELEKWIRKIEAEGEKAVEKVIGLLRYDHKLRFLVVERLKIDPADLDFLLGRPMTETIRFYGLKVIEEDGIYLLTTIEASTHRGISLNAQHSEK